MVKIKIVNDYQNYVKGREYDESEGVADILVRRNVAEYVKLKPVEVATRRVPGPREKAE
jgi:hypothetical protein